jgi:hypothetical protein
MIRAGRPNKPLKLTPLRGREIGGILTIRSSPSIDLDL